MLCALFRQRAGTVSDPGRRPQGQRSGPPRALPLFGTRVARLGCRDSPSQNAPTSVLRAQRASWPPRSGQGQGSRRGYLQPRAPSPRHRLPCEGPRAEAAASRAPKARSSERTGAGQRARPPLRPRIPPEGRSGLRVLGRSARRRAWGCGGAGEAGAWGPGLREARAGRGGAGAGAGPPREAGPSAGRGRQGTPL